MGAGGMDPRIRPAARFTPFPRRGPGPLDSGAIRGPGGAARRATRRPGPPGRAHLRGARLGVEPDRRRRAGRARRGTAPCRPPARPGDRARRRHSRRPEGGQGVRSARPVPAALAPGHRPRARAPGSVPRRRRARRAGHGRRGPGHPLDPDRVRRRAAAGAPAAGSRWSPDAAACIYYTSGSTGEPKGVLDTHRNVLHNVMRYTNSLGIGADDRLTLLQGPAFSGAVSSLFGALLNGAAVFPFDVPREGADRIAPWLARHGLTMYHSVPALFRRVATAGQALSALRVVRLEGDLAVPQDVELFQTRCEPGTVLVNGLGATECGLVRQYVVDHETSLTGGTVPIGYPVEDMEVLLLDPEGQPAAAGEVGEIVVRSLYLAAGYWDRPDLTDVAFRPSPGGRGLRLYRTGDMGRMAADACLEHLGRRDQQVKIRGERVDVESIQAALAGERRRARGRRRGAPRRPRGRPAGRLSRAPRDGPAHHEPAPPHRPLAGARPARSLALRPAGRPAARPERQGRPASAATGRTRPPGARRGVRRAAHRARGRARRRVERSPGAHADRRRRRLLRPGRRLAAGGGARRARGGRDRRRCRSGGLRGPLDGRRPRRARRRSRRIARYRGSRGGRVAALLPPLGLREGRRRLRDARPAVRPRPAPRRRAASRRRRGLGAGHHRGDGRAPPGPAAGSPAARSLSPGGPLQRRRGGVRGRPAAVRRRRGRRDAGPGRAASPSGRAGSGRPPAAPGAVAPPASLAPGSRPRRTPGPRGPRTAGCRPPWHGRCGHDGPGRTTGPP